VPETAFTRAWNIRHPIASAPMGHVSGGALAAAVSGAGGVGFIGVAVEGRGDILREAAIPRARGLPFGVGLVGWIADARPEIFEAVLEAEPFAVSLSFTDPAPYAARVRHAGARLVVQVQDRPGAERALEAGADVLVIQGADAGGHARARVGTLPLVQALLPLADSAGVPALAAGGIGDGRALAGVLAMGAAGAWIGTRFRATREAGGSADAKRRLVEAGEDETEQSVGWDVAQGVPWPEHFPGRALRSADFAEPAVWASAAVGVIEDLPPAGEVVERLAAEADERLASFGA